MNDETKNPWLQISSEDYDGHMSHPSVMQLQMLDKIFNNILEDIYPSSIAILGCTAGSGFQHLLNREFEKVVGIDINFSYLAECKAWFIQDVPNLQLICADLNELEMADESFDLIHAALIFEYVDVEKVLSKISRWLKPDGIMCSVLQLPGDQTSPVSDTPFESLKLLSSIMKLVELEDFLKKAKKYGLEELENCKIELESGKIFWKIIFKRNSIV